jgi:hypothetical protein
MHGESVLIGRICWRGQSSVSRVSLELDLEFIYIP